MPDFRDLELVTPLLKDAAEAAAPLITRVEAAIAMAGAIGKTESSGGFLEGMIRRFWPSRLGATSVPMSSAMVSPLSGALTQSGPLSEGLNAARTVSSGLESGRSLVPKLDGWIPGPRQTSIRAVEFIRPAAIGGTRPAFIGASDGNVYLTKYCGNPQGSNVLANSLLANHVYHHMEILVPQFSIIDLSPQFVERNRALLPLAEPGPAFGSKEITGAVERTALSNLDYQGVVNISDFGKVMVTHPFVNNFDTAQYMVQTQGAHKVMFSTDLAYAFGGKGNVSIERSFGFAPRRVMEATGATRTDFASYLGRLGSMPEQVLREPLRNLPRQWLNEGTEAALTKQVDLALRPETVDGISRRLDDYLGR